LPEKRAAKSLLPRTLADCALRKNASKVSLLENGTGNCVCREKFRRTLRRKKAAGLVFFFVAAQKFVALNSGDHANLAFVARLRALNASQAAHAHWAGQGDFVGKVSRISTAEPSFTSLASKK